MPSLGEDIVALLSANEVLVDAVGIRIYPLQMAAGAIVPAIVYTPVIDGALQTLTGPSELRRALVQIDCFAERYIEADRIAGLAEAIFAARVVPGAPMAVVFPRRNSYDDETRYHRASFDVSYWRSAA